MTNRNPFNHNTANSEIPMRIATFLTSLDIELCDSSLECISWRATFEKRRDIKIYVAEKN